MNRVRWGRPPLNRQQVLLYFVATLFVLLIYSYPALRTRSGITILEATTAVWLPTSLLLLESERVARNRLPPNF